MGRPRKSPIPVITYLPEDEIVPRKKKKPIVPTKEQRDAIRAPLKRRMDILNNKVKQYLRLKTIAEESRDKAKATKKRAVNNAVERMKNFKDYKIRKIRNKKYGNSVKIANMKLEQKLKRYMLYHSDTLASVSAFPIITKWCQQEKVKFDTFSIFILINHYEWFTHKDGLFFGYSEDVTRTHCLKLSKLGLAQRISQRPAVYTSSVLGKETFVDFKKYHKERIEVLMEEFSKSVDPNTDPFQFSLFRNKKRKNANKQEDTGEQQDG